MRYHIDTIPVWDALRTQGECSLCTLRRKAEHTLADRYLGASVMEPDARIRVNAKGFCPPHHRMLYARQNRLGHALMMLSHVREVRKKLAPLLDEPARANQGGLFERMRKRPQGDGVAPSFPMAALAEGCVLCDTLNESMDRYAYTLLHLWKTDEGFQRELRASRGFCLPDTVLLLDMATQHLSGKHLDGFRQAAATLLSDNLKRLDEELEWFTLKFDYRNNDKPWGESRDALERTIQKLRGWSVGKDPGLDE